ncbi:NAD(P)-binding domain-containing protein [Flavobacterium poyangense]|uniref:NAD(P)-binding domain-containing protein n=1 Tax=Flavobacterium poyangense TaxID=2204302 RepID=UPI001422CABC|nr:NAD(P)-binding domain-containing protein [Flavobacterium sp. JXAS1]
MKIGIIGIGSLTLKLAIRSARAGYKITLHNPRGNSLIRESVKTMGATAALGTLEQAAAADIILLFLPKDDLESVLPNLPDMSGKIIVHTSSLIFDPGSLLSGITHGMTYRITVCLIPEAHIVKLFTPVSLKPAVKTTAHTNRQELFFISSHKASGNGIRNFLKTLDFLPIDLTGRLKVQNTAMNLKSISAPPAGPFADQLN